MIAMPTQAERLHGQFQEKQETLKDTKKEKLFDQYGGAEHVEEKLPDRLRFGGTEVYREYTQVRLSTPFSFVLVESCAMKTREYPLSSSECPLSSSECPLSSSDAV